MIASDRSQNIIVATMIIAALVSSVFLINNAMFYSGSYALVGGMQVEMLTPAVSNIDVANESVSPRVSISFNLHATSPFDGNMRITFVGAQVTLNGDLLSYMQFAKVVPVDQQSVHPGYNATFELAQSPGPDELEDRDTIISAYNMSYWNWTVMFRYSYIVFDEPGSISWVYIPFQMVAVVLP